MDLLDRAVAGLDAYLADGSISPARLVNPMLLVWDSARAVDPMVALPVEELLTSLLHRTVLCAGEVRASTAEVRARALQVLILQSDALTG